MFELEQLLKERFDQWMKWDKNADTKYEIESLQHNPEELGNRLLNRIKFGTAGLRSNMGAGFSQMNDLTIIQTTQGLVATCKNYNWKKGVIIGYDARYNSLKWAKIVANIFHRANIPVYLYSDTVPTPFIAFGVRHFQTLCGVMITASHNPKNDNGYKVYWENGCQIISPLDKEISDAIMQNLSPSEESWDYTDIDNHVRDPLAEVEAKYYELQKKTLSHNILDANAHDFPFVYTAMHGVGFRYAKEILKTFGFRNIISVKEQEERDPEFTTVKFPNPEEKGALNLAMQTADKHNITVVVANDPDADRLAAAERTNGHWRIFTGNEMGALMGWWIWSQKANSVKKEDAFMISSTVSSMILRTMAVKEGFNFIETLTGFKWMGNLADSLMKQGKTVLLAYEEAIGFMCGQNVLDKDGIGAIAVFVEMAAFLYSKGKTITQQLADIYSKYGQHVTDNGYLKSKSADLTNQMFEKLRKWNGTSTSYPEYCGETKYNVVKIRDLTTGYYSYGETNKLPIDPTNQMITFTFGNNCTLTIRASGTEPKIKYYSEIIVDPNDKLRTKESACDELQELVNFVKKHFYQRDVFGFTD